MKVKILAIIALVLSIIVYFVSNRNTAFSFGGDDNSNVDVTEKKPEEYHNTNFWVHPGKWYMIQNPGKARFGPVKESQVDWLVVINGDFAHARPMSRLVTGTRGVNNLGMGVRTIHVAVPEGSNPAEFWVSTKQR
jgi:hypothetical protein